MTKRPTELVMEQEIQNNPTVNKLGNKILRLLQEQNWSLSELYSECDAPSSDIDDSVRTLLTLKYISETRRNKCAIAPAGEQYLDR